MAIKKVDAIRAAANAIKCVDGAYSKLTDEDIRACAISVVDLFTALDEIRIEPDPNEEARTAALKAGLATKEFDLFLKIVNNAGLEIRRR